MSSARARVAQFWDGHVDAWLAGEERLPEPLGRWFDAYDGKGAGEATRDGFPEPYLGDLLGDPAPRVCVLSLNPGVYVPEFQARDGIFADEIRQYGSFSTWAATGPYLRPPWTEQLGRVMFWENRVSFARNWLGEPAATHRDLLGFECYPWHSSQVTAAMKPSSDIIHEYVMAPIAELPATEIFAFGRPWNEVAVAMGFTLVGALVAGGVDYGSQVPSRAVRIYDLVDGQRLVVEWHKGGAGPPSAPETAVLRNALR